MRSAAGLVLVLVGIGCAPPPREAVAPANIVTVPVARGADGGRRAPEIHPRAAGFAVGDPVEVEWRGTWYPATVMEVRDGAFLIHYEGYGKEWDEAVGPERIRGRDPRAEDRGAAR